MYLYEQIGMETRDMSMTPQVSESSLVNMVESVVRLTECTSRHKHAMISPG